jgi:hypothetical protein
VHFLAYQRVLQSYLVLDRRTFLFFSCCARVGSPLIRWAGRRVWKVLDMSNLGVGRRWELMVPFEVDGVGGLGSMGGLVYVK